MSKEWERPHRAKDPIILDERQGYISGHKEFRLFMRPDVYGILQKLAKRHKVSLNDEVKLAMLGFFQARDSKLYKEMRQHYEVMEPRLLDVFDRLTEKHE